MFPGTEEQNGKAAEYSQFQAGGYKHGKNLLGLGIFANVFAGVSGTCTSPMQIITKSGSAAPARVSRLASLDRVASRNARQRQGMSGPECRQDRYASGCGRHLGSSNVHPLWNPLHWQVRACPFSPKQTI